MDYAFTFSKGRGGIKGKKTVFCENQDSGGVRGRRRGLWEMMEEKLT